jgi:hypothetical protein
MELEATRESWRRYLYLTKDFDVNSDHLLSFDEKFLNELIIPEDWSSSEEIKKFHSELVANEYFIRLIDYSGPYFSYSDRGRRPIRT